MRGRSIVKKTGITIIAAICALCAVLVAVGCGGQGASSSSAAAGGNNQFVGNWTNMTEEMLDESAMDDLDVTELEAGENAAESDEASSEDASEEDSEDAESEEEADAAEVEFPLVSMFVTLNEDGTAEVAISGYSEEGTWTSSGSGATLSVPGTIPMNLSVSGDTMKVEQSGISVELKKTDRENPYSMGDMNWEEMLVEPEISDVEPVVIVDDDNVTITVTGKGTDYTGDAGFRLSVANKTQTTIGLDVEEAFSVGGAEVWAQAGVVSEEAEFMIEPGATSTDMFLYFPSDELGGGVEKLVDVTGKVSIFTEESDDYLATYDFKM